MTSRSPDDLFDLIDSHYVKAHHHLEQVGELIARYRDTLPIPGDSAARPATRRKGQIKSLAAWQDWLRDNGPAFRRIVADAVGNLSASATPHVRKWQPHMEFWQDGELPADTLMSVQAPPSARGRPQVIYFLWAQRFDVLPLFGVGPVRPDPASALTTLMVPEPSEDVKTESDQEPRPVPQYDWDGADEWPQLAFDAANDIGEVHTEPLTPPTSPEGDKPDD